MNRYSDKLFNSIYKKQLNLISKEAKKNNIEIFLSGGEVKTYSYGIKRFYGNYMRVDTYFDTSIIPIIYPRSPQEAFKVMLSSKDIIWFEKEKNRDDEFKKFFIDRKVVYI